MGFEPTIFGTTIRRFNQLSYTHHIKCNTAEMLHKYAPISQKLGSCPGKWRIQQKLYRSGNIGASYWIRTSGLLLRRQLLYPAELKTHIYNPENRGLWSGWWESNPRDQLGRLEFYHWTTPAFEGYRSPLCILQSLQATFYIIAHISADVKPNSRKNIRIFRHNFVQYIQHIP